MTQSADSPISPATIEDEHRILRALLGRLEETTGLEELVPGLAELRSLLAVHFAREEAPDGLHRVVDASAPHLVATVVHLIEEHGECLTALDVLIEAGRRCLEGPVAEVRSGVSELCRRLHEHEAAETELLAGAVYEEVGGGD
ncbi:MAG TPA: hemerythrin domain-containing protein [Thermoanaerobaculia bacterium]|nr:hemerythrin domain-containing protein [Thermoanaerobaculia bacterium]